MPRAEILSKQTLHTLKQLHAELAGKIESNRKSGDKLRAQMVQVEAVMKMLDPELNLRIIAPKRRVTGPRAQDGSGAVDGGGYGARDACSQRLLQRGSKPPS